MSRAVNMLIIDKPKQLARIEEKRRTVLRWLASEGYSTEKVLGELLGLQRNAIYKTIKGMERDGLIQRHELRSLMGKLAVLVGTPHGIAMGKDAVASEDWRDVESIGRIAVSSIAHGLDVQTVRVKAIKVGWADWISDRKAHKLSAEDGWLKIPDSIAVSPDGEVIAIEVERTIKTRKRYEAIISAYLQMIKKGKIASVVYVCPDADVAPRLSRIFESIDAVPVAGNRVSINDEHRAKFIFTSLERWPNHG